MEIDFKTMTIAQARELLDTRKVTAVELAQHALEMANRHSDLNIFISIYDDVLDQAARADELIAAGTSTPLLGIPLAIKDNILIQGKPASSSSRILENYIAPYTSGAMEKLLMQSPVIIGRTNMDEFAMGSSTENSIHGPTKNPLDTTRVAGGTSGGSAAAVAAGIVLGAYGTDTGGSVRQPSSFCGIVGLYGGYGSVSRYGIMASGSSLDQVGSMAKNAADVAILHAAVAGRDERDGTTMPDSKRIPLRTEVKKIGVPRSILALPGIGADVLENFEKSLEKLTALGYEVCDIELPHVEYSLAAYYIIQTAEVSTNLACYDGIRYGVRVEGDDITDTYFNSRGQGFGPEVQRRMLLGAYVLSAGYYDAYYGKATRLRNLITTEFKKAFDSVDIIAMPTAPSEAFKIGGFSDPVSMYAQDIFTVPVNLTGVPAMSVPSGVGANGLPLGLQLYAPWWTEQLLFDVSTRFETGM